MKSLQLLAAGTLPLIVGFLDHDVQRAVATGRWPTAIGTIIGFNGLFAIIAVILTIIFTIKSRTRAAWLSIAIPTLVSASLSGAAHSLDRYVDKASQESAEKKILNWNRQHQPSIRLDLKKCAVRKINTFRASKSGARVFEVSVSGLHFIGSLENRSPERIEAVVMDIAIVNGEKTIVSRRITFPVEVFSTATVSIDKTYEPMVHIDDSAVDELYRAKEQLPESKWTYQLVAVIPTSLEGLDVRKSLRVESELMATVTP
jgi:hypothetical protein